MLPHYNNGPVHIEFSFHKIIERLEDTARNGTGWRADNAKALLKKISMHPELRDGITTQDQIDENGELISELLADLFPDALTDNEIKAVSLPYKGFIFNHTKRFQRILHDAGPDFNLNIRDFDEHQFYVLSCCMILMMFYGARLDFRKPFFCDIPTATGVIKHYRILYNGDFLEILPTAKAPQFSQEEINELMDNYDNLALWKEKFPVGGWILKGFALMTLVDVTVENALSILKSNLLGSYSAPDIMNSLQSIFRSIFDIPDMRMGFTLFDQNEGKFGNAGIGLQIDSFLMPCQDAEGCQELLSGESYTCIMQDHTYFAVSDVDEFIKQFPATIGEHFKEKNLQSFILAPVVKNGALLGVLELASPRKRELNSVTANKLDIVMPFLTDTVDRKMHEMQNRVQAVIQDNYTTLHPSVYWKFRREALNFINHANTGLEYALKQITFKEVYPLYGQVDIGESSVTRNRSVQNDLRTQLTLLIEILEELANPGNTGIEEMLFDLRTFASELSLNIRADTEQFIQHYIESRAYPILQGAQPNAKIETYFRNTDALTGDFHMHRRDYDKTLSLINQKLATILDNRQAEIQEFFPHYYERFKTDGIEHNMYIGASIAPKQTFSMEHLHRLRLWQLRVIAEMEIEQFDLKRVLPYLLGVTSLILVFSTPIAIRFRMDEKHFDVDGAYNIRYEVIKKRLDKAHIKGTEERITQQGKITIIYSKAEEEFEYINYITILQNAGILNNNIEHFELEDLQGVSGLKALRVGIIHQQNLQAQRAGSYNDLYKQLN